MASAWALLPPEERRAFEDAGILKEEYLELHRAGQTPSLEELGSDPNNQDDSNEQAPLTGIRTDNSLWEKFQELIADGSLNQAEIQQLKIETNVSDQEFSDMINDGLALVSQDPDTYVTAEDFDGKIKLLDNFNNDIWNFASVNNTLDYGHLPSQPAPTLEQYQSILGYDSDSEDRIEKFIEGAMSAFSQGINDVRDDDQEPVDFVSLGENFHDYQNFSEDHIRDYLVESPGGRELAESIRRNETHGNFNWDNTGGDWTFDYYDNTQLPPEAEEEEEIDYDLDPIEYDFVGNIEPWQVEYLTTENMSASIQEQDRIESEIADVTASINTVRDQQATSFESVQAIIDMFQPQTYEVEDYGLKSDIRSRQDILNERAQFDPDPLSYQGPVQILPEYVQPEYTYEAPERVEYSADPLDPLERGEDFDPDYGLTEDPDSGDDEVIPEPPVPEEPEPEEPEPEEPEPEEPEIEEPEPEEPEPEEPEPEEPEPEEPEIEEPEIEEPEPEQPEPEQPEPEQPKPEQPEPEPIREPEVTSETSPTPTELPASLTTNFSDMPQEYRDAEIAKHGSKSAARAAHKEARRNAGTYQNQRTDGDSNTANYNVANLADFDLSAAGAGSGEGREQLSRADLLGLEGAGHSRQDIIVYAEGISAGYDDNNRGFGPETQRLLDEWKSEL